jgi:UrcA family protein
MLYRSLAAAAFLILGFSAAQADTTATSTTSTIVPYGDLNLAESGDAKVLAVRLQDAAKSVCIAANPDLHENELQSCIDTAIDMAMAQIANHYDEQAHARLVNVRQQLSTP